VKIILPADHGDLTHYRLKTTDDNVVSQTAQYEFNRVAYAAPHVVVDPTRHYEPRSHCPPINWDKTLGIRSYLYSLGFKVAEAMDTAQRGMGLGWATAWDLIRRSVSHARGIPGADLACGAGTDQLDERRRHSLSDIIQAYKQQFEAIEAAGGRAIMMASSALCATARDADDYKNVYDAVIAESRNPVILHWLGDAFNPTLAGYWGSRDIHEAMDTVLDIIRLHPSKIEGIKISLLNAEYERELRGRLPEGVRMYTGDDFNYCDLIEGDSTGESHALLGIFSAIAPAAAKGLDHLAKSDVDAYRRTMVPTVALSREIFRAPTQYYKAGVCFLAWLNGHQDHFSMAFGMESTRSVLHFAEVFKKADACGALIKPELAVQRMKALLQLKAGIEQ
jgi:hypothetical protein